MLYAANYASMWHMNCDDNAIGMIYLNFTMAQFDTNHAVDLKQSERRRKNKNREK